ncbi:hypothetical protein diail_8589 [Diaporthe ilicicola]|nr:hypothetical protein diail_8589 [Diaporthe ilicicola]
MVLLRQVRSLKRSSRTSQTTPRTPAWEVKLPLMATHKLMRLPASFAPGDQHNGLLVVSRNHGEDGGAADYESAAPLDQYSSAADSFYEGGQYLYNATGEYLDGPNVQILDGRVHHGSMTERNDHLDDNMNIDPHLVSLTQSDLQQTPTDLPGLQGLPQYQNYSPAAESNPTEYSTEPTEQP